MNTQTHTNTNTNKSKVDPQQLDVLKKRKRESRNDETVIFNAMIYMLNKVGYSVKIQRSKKTTKTIKMFLPILIEKDGKTITSNEIMEKSTLLLKQLGYEKERKERDTKPTESQAVLAKRAKRTKEAQMNNGILYILKENNFTFVEKKVKSANFTERLVRVNEFTYIPEGKVYSKDDLFAMGYYINSLMNQDENQKIVVLDQSILNHGPLENYLFSTESISEIHTNGSQMNESSSMKLSSQQLQLSHSQESNGNCECLRSFVNQQNIEQLENDQSTSCVNSIPVNQQIIQPILFPNCTSSTWQFSQPQFNQMTQLNPQQFNTMYFYPIQLYQDDSLNQQNVIAYPYQQLIQLPNGQYTSQLIFNPIESYIQYTN